VVQLANLPYLVAEACPPGMPSPPNDELGYLASIDGRLTDIQSRVRRWYPLRTLFGLGSMPSIGTSQPTDVLTPDPMRCGAIITVPGPPAAPVYMGGHGTLRAGGTGGVLLTPGVNVLFGQECPDYVSLVVVASPGTSVIVGVLPIQRADGVGVGGT
jgi:hypothetical protein